jgi:integrase/recombinase XerD
MSSIAPTLQLFFTERMARQLQASPRTVVSYRDTCRLLLRFVADRTGKAPSALGVAGRRCRGDLRLLGPPRSGPA